MSAVEIESPAGPVPAAPTPGPLRERARAKVNLTLHVQGRREDGWHDLESLVAFAGLCDTLSLTPSDDLALVVEGPGAAASGPVEANLVLKAARELARRRPGLRAGAFRLVKRIPVAAGLGGGSADAAAALRLLARANGLDPEHPDLRAAAAATGADVAVCLESRSRLMRGRGEDLGPPLSLPPVFAVLVNPGVPMETAGVFRQLGLAPGQGYGFGSHPAIPSSPDRETLVGLLRRGRNDLDDAAGVLAPVIVHLLAVLSGARGCRLARMSGSGATCFALFDDRRAALRAARSIRSGNRDWWVKATILR